MVPVGTSVKTSFHAVVCPNEHDDSFGATLISTMTGKPRPHGFTFGFVRGTLLVDPKGWFAKTEKPTNNPHSLPHLSNLASFLLSPDRDARKMPAQIAIGFVLDFRFASFG